MSNILYTGDNLYILHGMNSESVDLIYLDPPFNSKRMYLAPVGTKSAGASFKDMWTWADVNDAYLEQLAGNYPDLVKFIESIDSLHGKSMMAYITYMTQRLIELHRILKPTGSLYLHVDPTASHYLKLVLDRIFGKRNFRNEIVWRYETGGIPKKDYSRKHDIILRYTKTKDYLFFPSDIAEKRSHEVLRRIATGNKNATRSAGQTRHPSDVLLIPAINAMAKERTGYPTQKPLLLLENIISGSTREGDLVLDPFCGCATTCVKAQQLNRKWIGIDIEEQAAQLLIERLSDDSRLFKDFIHTKEIPQRTDVQKLKRSASVKQKLYQVQEDKCNGCYNQMRIFDFEIDHIIPESKGGGSYYENYQLLCGNCNRIKGDRPMEYLQMKIRKRQNLLNREITFGK